MKVRVLEHTKDPITAIAIAAGTSYGHSDPSPNRAKGCFMRGHMSVFEHATVTFKIEGISRACSHQLVRHRHFSFVQESQRYKHIDTITDWYVTPPGFEDNQAYQMFMQVCANRYNEALENGAKKEDARFCLPEAAKTSLTLTCNLRSLYEFLELRLDPAAQWEIRQLARMMAGAYAELGEQEAQVMRWFLGKIGCEQTEL